MSKRHYAAAVVATLLLAASGSAQSAADLLQQGIHAQETVGNLDGAIAIFRQVVASPSTNKLLAAQAQYQLVLCLLQKGDRTAASTEIQALAKNFPDQPDLLNKARQAMGPGETFLPAPWGQRETTQLKIRRDGQFTGETLFYSVEPDLGDKPNPQTDVLTWELNTANTRRSVTIGVDRDTMRPIPRRGFSSADPSLQSNDDMGDPAAAPLSGPAIDVQGSLFLMRRLPLAVGYKTTLTSLPFTIGQSTPKKLDLSVAAIEAVQTPSGKFNCYKVVFDAVGQTFWFNIDASRALVKFQSGSVVAERAAIWVGEDLAQAVFAPFKAAGWETRGLGNRGHYASGSVCNLGMGGYCLPLSITKLHTPAEEIPQSLKQALERELRENVWANGSNPLVVRPNGVQTLLIGGQQALSCIADRPENGPDKEKTAYYIVWIQTENTLVKFSYPEQFHNFAVSRWWVDQVISAAKLP